MTGTNPFRPNPAQEAAVAHGAGPLRLLAGAGSGKTTTLVRRILHLIHSGACAPGQLLMLTFTTKATADMRRKVAEALPPGSDQPRIETYHAYALALVQEFAAELGLAPHPALLTPGPVKLFTRRHFDRLGIQSMDLSRLDSAVKAALDFFSWHRHEGSYLLPDERLLAQVPPEEAGQLAELLEAHRRYRALLAEQGALDYDDLIAQAVELLERNEQVRRLVQERYPYLLVDEYQDTDHLQSRYIRLLAGDRANLTIVGDPDQTIYSWRGAAVSNILSFHERYPGVTTIPMVTNYRSTPEILAAANAVIAQNQRGKAEPLVADRSSGPRPQGRQAPDWESEARWLAQEALRLHEEHGIAWSEIAVLVRLNRHKLPLYGAMLEAGIPVVVVGGMDLLTDPETARFVAYLEALATPHDDNALAVALGLPRYGLTDEAIARLARDRKRDERLIDLVARCSVADAALARFLEEFWPLFQRQHAEGCEAAIRGALRLHAGSLGLQARLNADQLLPLAEGFFAQAALLVDPASTTPPLGQFCEYLRGLQEVGETPEGVPIADHEDGIRLMTVHAAKGLEFPVVFLPRLTDSDFPKAHRAEKRLFPQAWHHDAAEGLDPKELHFEEERRAFYVAITRAMDRLYLSWAPVDPARKKPLSPSRFIAELGETVEWRSVEAWASVPGALAAEVAAASDSPTAPAESPVASALANLVSTAPAQPLPAADPAAPFRARVPQVLSFSHLSTYQYCPYRFFLQFILRLPGRPTKAADAGVRIHAAIERLGESGGSWEEFRTWAAAPTESTELSWENDEAHPPTTDEEAALRNFWASEFGQTKPIASEQEFFVRLGKAVVRGFIDRIHRRPDGSVEVVDFKTYNHALSEQEVRQSLQLPLYLKACHEALGLPEVRTAAMYFLKQDATVRVSYTPAELQERLQAAEGLVEAIQSGRWEPTPERKACGWCPYGEICPASEQA